MALLCHEEAALESSVSALASPALLRSVADLNVVHRAAERIKMEEPKCEQNVKSEAPDATNSDARPENSPLDTMALGELLYHRSTRILQARMAASIPAELFNGSIPQLFNHLFLSAPYMYESICLAVPEWRKEANVENYGTYHPRAAIHRHLFAYILKRISCLPFIEDDGYRVNNHYSSATDAPFIYFLHALLAKARLGQPISEDPADLPSTVPGHGSTLILDDPRAVRAFEVFTLHPMRFLVQIRVEGNWLSEEYALVWCKDVEGTGTWDLIWEYMSKGLARIECPEGSYEF